jgi:hypothetical protein
VVTRHACCAAPVCVSGGAASPSRPKGGVEPPLPTLRRQAPRLGQGVRGGGGQGSLPDLAPLGPISENNMFRGFAPSFVKTQALRDCLWVNQVLPVESPSPRVTGSWVLQLVGS